MHHALPRPIRCFFMTAAFLPLALFPAAPALAGETAEFPGTELQTIGGHDNSLSTKITGGKSDSLDSNSVVMNSGTVAGNVYGAANYIAADRDAVTRNTAHIKDGEVFGNIYGGYSLGHIDLLNARSISNSAAVSGGRIYGSVYGGHGFLGVANGNNVAINGGSVDGIVRGGHSEGGQANGNSVRISGGSVGGYVQGGYAYNDPEGRGEANSNTVSISGGSVGGDVYGGYAWWPSKHSDASGNDIYISGGAVGGDVYGGFARNNLGPASAANNYVNISNGTVNGNIYGGYAWGPHAASGNYVIIGGGKVHGNIYGGYAGNFGQATRNYVSISGKPDLSNSNIYGGYVDGSGADYERRGNFLELRSAVTVAGLYNFENLHFFLPKDLAAGGAMLLVTGTASIKDAAIKVSLDGAGPPLRAGDTVVLIDSPSLADPANSPQAGIVVGGMQGVTLGYAFGLDAADGRLLATVIGNSPGVAHFLTPQTKALSEGFVAGLALVNQGADLIAGKGMNEAVDAAGRAGVGFGFGAFGALSGGWSRYDTGSRVDVSGLSLMAGLSFGADLPPGRLTLGAFFEFGTGSYSARNSFSDAADVDGKGNMHHLGGGVLGRMDFIDAGPGNFYTEASFRVGGAHNDYYSSDLRDAAGRRAEYDSYSAYRGFHAGLGYVWSITDKASLDLNGKYFRTRQQGDSVRLSTGDPVKFKDADSSRLRFGGRFAYAVNEYLSPYIGAAYEHEFDGKARAAANGFDINAPSLRGDTGIGELGLTLKPSKDLPLSFDLGVQGYVGKREGVTGSLQIRLEF